MLNSLPGVTSVHSRFYDLSSKYYQTVGNHAAYYKDALRFLGCVDIKDLPGNVQPWTSLSKEHVWRRASSCQKSLWRVRPSRRKAQVGEGGESHASVGPSPGLPWALSSGENEAVPCRPSLVLLESPLASAA